MKQYSYTKLTDYLRCPFYYHCRHERKLKAEVDFYTIGGRAAHDIICEYTNACYQKKVTHLGGGLAPLIAAAIKRHRVSADLEDDVAGLINHWASGTEIALEGLAGVEQKFALNKKLQPGAWEGGFIRLKIDKLYINAEECLIEDYKTGYAMAADKYQLLFYAWVLSKVFPHIKRFQGAFDYVRFHFKKVYEITAQDIEKTETKSLELIHEIETCKEFKPRVNSKCAVCPYWSLCPAVKAKHIPKAPGSLSAAEKLLAAIVVKQKEIAELTGLLRTYVDTRGRVLTNDMVATYAGQTAFKWDFNAVVKWAVKHKINLARILAVDSEETRKLLDERLGQGKYPRELVEVQHKARFVIKKYVEKKKK